MKTLFYFKLIFCLTFFISGFSQDGSPDLSFGIDGTIHVDINGNIDTGASISQQSNGKLIVVGATESAGISLGCILRFLDNGSLDSDFGNNGVVLIDIENTTSDYFDDILVQNNDKMLLSSKYFYNGNYRYEILRVSSEGILDQSFGVGGKITPFLDVESNPKMLLLSDDSIITMANVDVNNIRVMLFQHYFENGVLDTSYGDNGTVTIILGNESNRIREVELMANGSIVVMADITDNGSSNSILYRILPNGNLDVGFGFDGVIVLQLQTDFDARQIAVFDDGKVAVLSYYINWLEEYILNQITRYSVEGTIDTGFGDNGSINYIPSLQLILNLIVQQNQRLITTGEITNLFEGGGPTLLNRFYYSGHEDPSFQQTTVLNIELFQWKSILQEDGKIVILAQTPWYNGPEDIVLERYNNSPLSVSDFTLKNLVVSPNPSNGVFNITCESIFNPGIKFQVTDLTGKLIQKGVLEEIATKLDLSAYQNGMYFFNAGGITLKLIKE